MHGCCVKPFLNLYICIMTTAFFTYNKAKVIQALRYHFISRREIKIMMVLVNVFALLSAALFFFKKISPFAFLISSFLWFMMMILFWFLLPYMVYRRSSTFKDEFRMHIDDSGLGIENDRGQQTWAWSEFSSWMESPHFFHMYFNSRSFFIFPKDAFEGDDEHAARKIIAARVGK